MRRSCALIVLAMFMSVPALQLRCAVSCAPQDRADTPAGCPYHQHHDTEGPLLVRAADCCLEAGASAGVAALVTHHSPERPALLADRVAPARGTAVENVRASFAAPPHGRPPGSSGTPLRI